MMAREGICCTLRGSTADCTDVGLTARSYRSARMTVEIVCRLGCPSASTCIHCATRFNLIATCCEAIRQLVCPRDTKRATSRSRRVRLYVHRAVGAVGG